MDRFQDTTLFQLKVGDRFKMNLRIYEVLEITSERSYRGDKISAVTVKEDRGRPRVFKSDREVIFLRNTIKKQEQ